MFSPLNFFGKEATLVVDRVRVCSPSSIMFHFWCRVSHCSWFKKWSSAPGRSRGHSHFYHFESAHQLAVTPYVYDPTYVYIYMCVCTIFLMDSCHIQSICLYILYAYMHIFVYTIYAHPSCPFLSEPLLSSSEGGKGYGTESKNRKPWRVSGLL